MFSQFMGAEMIAKKYGLTADDLDAYALESHKRAPPRPKRAPSSARSSARVETPDGRSATIVDEGIRFDATLEGIGSVKMLQEGGVDHRGQCQPDLRRRIAVLIVSRTGAQGSWPDPASRASTI
jgi:acetyl-CoA C-acetyltransferase